MELPTKSRYWKSLEDELDRLGSQEEAREAKTMLRRFVESCYTQIGGKWTIDGDKADGYAVAELRKTIELLNKAALNVLRAWPKEDVEYPSLNRLAQALLAVQTRIVQKQTEFYKQALDEAASLTEPAEWDRRVSELLQRADIDWQGRELPPDKEYLVIAVCAYLLDMANLPWNAFDQYLRGDKPQLSSSYLGMLRQFVELLRQQSTPTIALGVLRGLRQLISSADGEVSEPDWVSAKLADLQALGK